MRAWFHGPGFRLGVTLLALLVGGGAGFSAPAKGKPQPVVMVVMDPLAKELACACVKGFGQRDYRKLASRLESALKQPVTVEFSDDLAESIKLAGPDREVIAIGEQSAVARGAKQAELKSHPICVLTDPEGSTSLTGSFVVRSGDPASELKDIGGRKILFGLADTDENHAATLAALRAAGVTSAAAPEKRGSYSDAALDVLDSQTAPYPVAVIPGYALRLLEGCGSITPGSLKVIGKTQPMPFVTVFVSDNIPTEKEQKILKSLLSVKDRTKLLKAMESKDGFKPVNTQNPSGQQMGAADWPDWRGPARDGHVPRLPARLPATAKFVWKKAAMTGGLAGLSVSNGRLILAERDFADEHDVYRCLDADTGKLLWLAQFSAPGKLDYGQSPRATPVIHKDKVYLLGAFGELHCVKLTNGKVIWKRHLLREFKAELPTWGMCSPPLVVDDLLIVNPGSANASLVALDCNTGRTRWTAPGAPAAYGAFIHGEFGGRHQIVGYDQHSLGGWDAKTGVRLWRIVPPTEGDFNVPTPIATNNGILVATENNGTRLYHFDAAGKLNPNPVGNYQDLSPDTTTPVVAAGRVFGTHLGLHCLDIQNGLKRVWRHEDNSLGDYATLIADNERVLVITIQGELILLDGRSDECAIISRLRLFDDDAEAYSHPALVGTRLYARGGSSVVCADLGVE